MDIFELLEKSGIFILGKNDSDHDVYIRRIHELLWIKIDQNGFVELVRKNENRNRFVKITLPKPIKCEKDLQNLMEVMGG